MKNAGTTMASRLNKRFPRRPKVDGKRIIRETAKQKEFRKKYEHVDWKKERLRPSLLSFSRGSGKTFSVVSLLCHNPCEEAYVACEISLIHQWADVVKAYQHKTDGAALIRVMGYQRMQALSAENHRLFDKAIVMLDEGHIYRKATENTEYIRSVCFPRAVWLLLITGTILMNNEMDLIGAANLLSIDLPDLIKQDCDHQKKHGNDLFTPEEIRKAKAKVSTVAKGDKRKSKLEVEESITGYLYCPNGTERFVPSSLFFSLLRQELDGRVSFTDPFRDAESLEVLRAKRVARMKEKGKSPAEIAKAEAAIDAKKAKEVAFPKVDYQERLVPMSLPQFYHVIIHKNRGATEISGHRPEPSASNAREAASIMLCWTYATELYCTKTRAARIMKGKPREELALYNFKQDCPSVTSTKLYAMAEDVLDEAKFPQIVHCPYLDNGVFELENCIRTLEYQRYGFDPEAVDSMKAASRAYKSDARTKTKKRKSPNNDDDGDDDDDENQVPKNPAQFSSSPVGKRPLRIACWTGNETSEQRSNIRQRFNSGDIDVLVISRAASTGCDLPSCQSLYLSVLGNDAEEKQTMSRGIRLGSRFSVVYIKKYISTTLDWRKKLSEAEIQAMQDIWELETGNPRNNRDGTKNPHWEDVRDEVIPTLLKLAKTFQTFDEKRRNHNIQKKKDLELYDLTFEVADPNGTLANKVKWNLLTKQPPERRMATTNRTAKRKDGDETETNAADEQPSGPRRRSLLEQRVSLETADFDSDADVDEKEDKDDDDENSEGSESERSDSESEAERSESDDDDADNERPKKRTRR